MLPLSYFFSDQDSLGYFAVSHLVGCQRTKGEFRIFRTDKSLELRGIFGTKFIHRDDYVARSSSPPNSPGPRRERKSRSPSISRGRRSRYFFCFSSNSKCFQLLVEHAEDHFMFHRLPSELSRTKSCYTK